MSTRLSVAAALAVTLLGACNSGPEPETAGAQNASASSPTPTTADLAAAMLDAMGGRAALESIDTLVSKGDGTRTRLGQIPETGGVDPTGRLVGVTETIDFESGRAAFDNDIVNDGFEQHRTEVLTTFRGEPVGWGTTRGRPNIVTSPNGLFSWATQNHPGMLLRRNVVTVALAAADTASSSTAAEERSFNGETSVYGTATLPGGEQIELYFDPATGLLDGFVALDTETMLGDVEAEYVFGDYRQVQSPGGPLTLPHSLTIRKDRRPYSSIDYTSIVVNDPAATALFDVPSDVVGQAEQAVAADGDWVPLEWNQVAPNIYHAVAFSHHSMVVEFPSFVAVVEGPYTEAQSMTLARTIEREIGKPIRYVAPTHPHYDHTGGIRGLAAVGADVLVAAGHEAELRGIVEAPHTNPPDELARRASAGDEVGTVQMFEGTTSITDGDQRLELYEVDSIPHVKPKVLAYVPSEGVLFQSDLFFGAPGPDAAALYAAVVELGLDVETIVGGHGGTWPFSSLEEVAAGAGN